MHPQNPVLVYGKPRWVDWLRQFHFLHNTGQPGFLLVFISEDVCRGMMFVCFSPLSLIFKMLLLHNMLLLTPVCLTTSLQLKGNMFSKIREMQRPPLTAEVCFYCQHLVHSHPDNAQWYHPYFTVFGILCYRINSRKYQRERQNHRRLVFCASTEDFNFNSSSVVT